MRAIIERERLGPVVLEHEFTDLGGHLGEHLVALGAGEPPVAHELVEEDLDVHLVVAAVDAGRVVDRVGEDQPTRQRVLDPGQLCEAQVAALADHPGSQFGAVDPHRVVGTVADVGMRLAVAFT